MRTQAAVHIQVTGYCAFKCLLNIKRNFHQNIFTVSDEVEDESAALIKFKTQFTNRYCNRKPGPDFTTIKFDFVFNQAFGGPISSRKPLGLKLFIFFILILLTKRLTVIYFIGISFTIFFLS